VWRASASDARSLRRAPQELAVFYFGCEDMRTPRPQRAKAKRPGQEHEFCANLVFADFLYAAAIRDAGTS
jgi:hypothetical protein